MLTTFLPDCHMGYVTVDGRGQWAKATDKPGTIPEFTPISNLSISAREFLIKLMVK